ncbi:MAG: DapH/DapD/GlmU-related protein [Desulfocapsaceae bacterium]|nr:DapH/DapD/GlmU-related protein [Desulfocapsaceae bacterium]
MLSEEPTVAPTARVEKTTLGRYTEVGANVRLQEVHLDDYSYVVDRSDVIYTDIGKFVNIASDVRINPGNHPMEWVSQHHFLYRIKQYGLGEEDNQPFFNWRRLQRVTIGHDVWIGHKAIVLPGVTVGNGAVVAAGAVVSRDVKPYSVVGGVPAKPLRSRFPEPIWRCLEEIQWWNWDHETIKERLDDFYDIRRFLDLYGNT